MKLILQVRSTCHLKKEDKPYKPGIKTQGISERFFTRKKFILKLTIYLVIIDYSKYNLPCQLFFSTSFLSILATISKFLRLSHLGAINKF